MQPLARNISLGIVKGLAVNDANGKPCTRGIGAPKNSKSGTVRLYQVQVGPQLKTAQLISQAGEDFSLANGSIVALMDMDGWLLIVACNDTAPVDTSLLQGEKKIFSTDGFGTILARHKFKSSGKQFIGNGSANLMTALSNLLTANSNLITALTTFTTGLNVGTLTAQAAACAAALPAISSALSGVNTTLGQILDASE